MTILKRTCREVATILVAREDRALRLADRVALRIHMTFCDACPKFERQMLTMRSALARWRSYSSMDDTLDR